jgi:hypothetical protein
LDFFNKPTLEIGPLTSPHRVLNCTNFITLPYCKDVHFLLGLIVQFLSFFIASHIFSVYASCASCFTAFSVPDINQKSKGLAAQQIQQYSTIVVADLGLSGFRSAVSGLPTILLEVRGVFPEHTLSAAC